MSTFDLGLYGFATFGAVAFTYYAARHGVPWVWNKVLGFGTVAQSDVQYLERQVNFLKEDVATLFNWVGQRPTHAQVKAAVTAAVTPAPVASAPTPVAVNTSSTSGPTGPAQTPPTPLSTGISPASS